MELKCGAVSPVDIRVLVVEDHPINQILLTKLLQKLGVMQVHCTVNGREALEALEKQRYDLVFMDCQMPELDGYETTRAIRLREAAVGGRQLIIAMTSNASLTDKDACFVAGMDDYVGKPVSLPKLQQALERWFNVRVELPVQTRLPADEDEIEEENPIDLDHIRRVTDDNIEEQDGLFCIFLAAADETVSHLQWAAASENNAVWRTQAHLLKGAAGNVGAQGLFRLCDYAEKNYAAEMESKQGILEGIHSELEQIRQFIEQVQGGLSDQSAVCR